MKKQSNTKGQAVRNAIDAHGWVGLVISVPLFLVFWAGAITLFYPEVQRWAALPHFPVDNDAVRPPLNNILEEGLANQLVDSSRRLSLRLPSEHSPYLHIVVPVYDSPEFAAQAKAYQQKKLAANEADGESTLEKPQRSKQWKRLMIDPASGKVLAEASPFRLAAFLDRMHFSLMLPQGLYIVGVMTFFFLVIVFTGIVIQFKNMIRHFFLYRHDKATRYQMNDVHNVVGVISLPFGLMYALTGLMFNLSIVFQVPTLFLVFNGDLNALSKAAGLLNIQQEAAYVEADLPDIDALLHQVETENNTQVQSIRFTNYGDKNALIAFSGLEDGSFSNRVDQIYSVASGDFPDALNASADNVFNDGSALLFSVHMGSFAGVDLRFIYFVLAMAFCGMIVAGNVLWIAKRQKQTQYTRAMNITRGITLGGCVGVLPATAVAFLLERILPVGLEHRGDWVMWSFGVVLFVSAVAAFFNRDYKRFVALSVLLAAAILALLVVVDILWLGGVLFDLQQSGYNQPWSVTLALAAICVIFAWIGVRLRGKAGSSDMSIVAQQAAG